MFCRAGHPTTTTASPDNRLWTTGCPAARPPPSNHLPSTILLPLGHQLCSAVFALPPMVSYLADDSFLQLQSVFWVISTVFYLARLFRIFLGGFSFFESGFNFFDSCFNFFEGGFGNLCSGFSVYKQFLVSAWWF